MNFVLLCKKYQENVQIYFSYAVMQCGEPKKVYKSTTMKEDEGALMVYLLIS